MRGGRWLGCAASAAALACGAAPDGRLELLDFRQNELDTVGLNEELSFYFSEDLEQGSVTSESVRIVGPEGRVVEGRRVVRGNALTFLPELPCESDLSDGGLRPGEDYRVVLGGFPRPDGLRARSGAVLSASLSLAFRTAEPGKSPLFLDPFVGPYPLIPRGRRSSPLESEEALIVLEDGWLVLECAEALDPSHVPGCRFELRRYVAGSDEWEEIPLSARLISNLRDRSELLLEPASEELAGQRLSPGKYYLQMPGRELRTLGGRVVEPGWRLLTLVVPQARVELDFDEPRERSHEEPPGCNGTALWSDAPLARGFCVRYPAAAGGGTSGFVELREPPAERDLHATRLLVPAGATVDLTRVVGPVVLRAQTSLEVRGRLARRGAGAQHDPLADELASAGQLAEEHWEPLSAWLEQLLAPAPDRASEPWTVLIAGGDIRVPHGGAIEVEGPLVLIAGGWIRVGGEVLSHGDLWKTPEGGGVASHGRFLRLPLALDPPATNPLRARLVAGVLGAPFQWSPHAAGWSALLEGHEGAGSIAVRWVQGPPGKERVLEHPDELAPGPARPLVLLELGAAESEGEAWDPPRLESLELEARPAPIDPPRR